MSRSTIDISNFKKRNCPICDSDNLGFLFKGERHNLGLTVYICRECYHIFLNPSPTKEFLEDFYKKEYRVLYNDALHVSEDYLKAHDPIKTGVTRNAADIIYLMDKIKKDESKIFNILDRYRLCRGDIFIYFKKSF